MTNYERIKNMSVEDMASFITVLLTVHLNKFGVAMGLGTVTLTDEETAETAVNWKLWLETIESEVTEE